MSALFDRFLRRPNPPVPPVTPARVHWLDVTPVNSADQPCKLRTLDVCARVSGLFAEITQTLVIQNPNERPISASVMIPLPDSAVVCGYALDVEGTMVDGVVVPKQKARVVFETEQRRGADPGLVEAVRGNVYRTRVYPVPAKGERTVRLSYVTTLCARNDEAMVLELPMPPERLKRRSVLLEVEQIDAPKPVIEGLGSAGVEDVRGVWRIQAEEENPNPSERIQISLPQLPSSFAMLERDKDGTVWFAASKKVLSKATGEVPKLTALTVLWDASGSRANVDHTHELELLRNYCACPSLKQITLVEFANRVRSVREFHNGEELVGHLSNVRYDGGTNLPALVDALEELPQASVRAADGGACVLFCDGLDTLSDEPFALPRTCDVLAIVSGHKRDFEAMRQACKGLAVSLDLAPRTAEELAGMFARSNPNHMLEVQGTGIANVCDAGVQLGQYRTVLGQLEVDQTNLRLGEDLTIALNASDARAGDVLARTWAARRVSILSVRAEDNADALLELGKRYGVVSPVTSLIALERLDQWLEHEIEPPASLPKLLDEWRRVMAGKMNHTSNEQRAARHHASLAHEWAKVMQWWERDFSVEAQAREEERTNPRPLAPENVSTRSENGTAAFTRSARMAYRNAMSHLDMADNAAPMDAPMAATPMRGPMPNGTGFLGRAANYFTLGMEDALDAPDALMPPAALVYDQQAHSPSMAIRIKPWSPHAPYLKALEKATRRGQDAAQRAYFEHRADNCMAPSFFLDCAGWFMAHGNKDFAVAVLSNLAEMHVEDAALLRVMAWRLREAGYLLDALVALRRVLRMRPEDAQSHRDVALVLDELARESFAQGNQKEAHAYAEEAATHYHKVALTPWDRHPVSVGLFAVEEYNALRAWADAQAWEVAPDLPSLGDDLEGVPDCDLRITLAWDADETDVDLHVTEPSGEEAYYMHRLTFAGGRVSEDIRDGYGPEQYEIRRAKQGTYTIRAHYFASHQQAVFGPATCTLTVYSDWGRPKQSKRVASMRLDKEREMQVIGSATYGDMQELKHQPVDATTKIAVGMSINDVLEFMGEPTERNDRDSVTELLWDLEGDCQLVVVFINGRVTRIIERMSWGDELIRQQ